MVDLGVERTACLRQGAQVGRVALHHRYRCLSLDGCVSVSQRLHATYPRTLPIQVSHYISSVVVGNRHIHDHDRLEQLRSGITQSLPESH